MKTESGGAVATQAAPAAAPAAAAPAAAGATPAAPAAGEGAKPAESGKPEVDDYKPNSTMIEMVVNFLMRVALITAEPKETAALSERCVKLLDKALGIWQGAVLKFQYFEKVIEKSENHPANLHMGLEIFNVILERQMVKVTPNIESRNPETHTEQQTMLKMPSTIENIRLWTPKVASRSRQSKSSNP
jgi:hypothetical protein